MTTKAPILLVFAGPNGAGKSTLQRLLFAESNLPFVNADEISNSFGLGAYEAAKLAEAERHRLVKEGKSFSFETVLSDPAGAKVSFLKEVREAGYQVTVHFIGLASAEFSRARVFQRVTEGGHDVPDEKIESRYPRILENLARLIGAVDELTIYDNSNSREPYRVLARFEGSQLIELSTNLPDWIAFLTLPSLENSGTISLP